MFIYHSEVMWVINLFSSQVIVSRAKMSLFLISFVADEVSLFSHYEISYCFGL